MMSARQIGEELGLSAAEVNQRLKILGYLEGTPGNYSLTALGEMHGEMRYKDNGYGGYAARSWSFPMWNDDVIDDIRNI